MWQNAAGRDEPSKLVRFDLDSDRVRNFAVPLLGSVLGRRGILRELALRGRAINSETAGRFADILIGVVKKPLKMFPFETREGENRRFRCPLGDALKGGIDRFGQTVEGTDPDRLDG